EAGSRPLPGGGVSPPSPATSCHPQRTEGTMYRILTLGLLALGLVLANGRPAQAANPDWRLHVSAKLDGGATVAISALGNPIQGAGRLGNYWMVLSSVTFE